jgi:drug/metabolite transporter (DMT)-like permease
VLGSAVLHASWNALLRAGADRLNAITVMCAVSAVAGALVLPFLPQPASVSWPFLTFSAVAECIYCAALAKAYDAGLLAEVYPIARGTSPMLVTAGALALVHERLAAPALFGVALVSGGIIGVAFGRGRPNTVATLTALFTGVMIASYTVSDGLGARASGSPVAYTCWMFLVQGALMPLLYAGLRRRAPTARFDPDTAKNVIGGVLSLAAYAVVVWALSRAPMGQVSALRETGILFAMIIGVLFLRERPSGRQMVAAAVIAAGAAILA